MKVYISYVLYEERKTAVNWVELTFLLNLDDTCVYECVYLHARVLTHHRNSPIWRNEGGSQGEGGGGGGGGGVTGYIHWRHLYTHTP